MFLSLIEGEGGGGGGNFVRCNLKKNSEYVARQREEKKKIEAMLFFLSICYTVRSKVN